MPVTADRRLVPAAPERKSYARIPEVLPIPDLIELQRRSYDWFVDKGLRDLFDEISPISDFTGKAMELHFARYEFGDPKYDQLECRTRDLTFSRPLYVDVVLHIKETGEQLEQRVYMGDFPTMTERGTFIINGAERVVVSQLVRSPGVYYTSTEDAATGRQLFAAKVIPNRGAWLEFETAAKNQLYVKVDRKRKLEATKLLRAVGYETDEEMMALFAPVDNGEVSYIAATLERDNTNTRQEALIEVYKKLRPGDPPTGDNAEKLVESLFFNFRRYDLGRVGRYKFNKKLGPVADRMRIELPSLERTITKQDIAAIVGHLIELDNGLGNADDIDHLGNRRIRANGELIQNAFRVGLLRMERVVKERMTIQEPEKATPNVLINIRPVVAAMKEFFGGSQLSQFMDQTNPLAELTSKRRLSALGPGGLSRERAGFDVRDVHHSHYGRICPIETPEGPNIGLIGSLATYGRINEYGFIETPYRRVRRSVSWKDHDLDRDIADADVVDAAGKVVLKAGKALTPDALEALKAQKARDFPVRPRVTDDIEYLAAYDEEERYVAQANARLDDCRPLRRREGPGTPSRPVPRGAAAADRLHGREPQAGRVRGHRAHPVPRARRREPRAHGLEHAAPGGAAPRAGVADRGHRHGEPRGARLGPGHRGAGRGRRDVGDRLAHPGRGGRGRALLVPAREVRALQPGHLHQPPAHRGGRLPGDRGLGPRGLLVDRPGRARARAQRARGVHELGGWQLRGRHRHQRPPRPRGPLHEHPHREARARVARHEARARGDHPRHPQRRRGVPQGPRRGRGRLHRRGGPARRHPRRQDHAEGRDRADRRGAAPARDLRREGARGEGLEPAPAPRGARQGRRHPRVQPRQRRRAAARRQPAHPRQRRRQAQDLRRRQGRRASRQQGRRGQDPAAGGHAVPPRRHARSTSSSTRSASRAA